MIEVKSDFSGGLNLDDALYNVPRNSYIDALNITRDAIEGSNDKAFTNIVGNQLVDYTYPAYSSLITITPNSSTTGTTRTQRFVFTGADYVARGWTFNIYLYNVSTSQQFLAATYTTTEETQLITVAQALATTISSVTGITGAISYFGTDNKVTLEFVFQTTTYNYRPATIVKAGGYGTRKCIGAYANTVRNTIVYFIYNSAGYHCIMEYNNLDRSIYPILTNLVDSGNVDILDFRENNKITCINIYNRNIEEEEGDILYFLDSLKRPTQLDILKFKNKEYTPVTRDIIDVLKAPPLFPPTCSYGNDVYRTTNSLRNRLFRFKYRYIYDSNQKSVCSPISIVPLPYNILKNDYVNLNTNNNKIDFYFNTGDKDVKSVQLLMSYVNKTNDWSDFSLIENINKDTFSFLNADIEYYALDSNSKQNVVFNFYGYVVPDIVITIKITNISTGLPVLIATYTTISSDTLSSVTTNIYNLMVASGIPYITYSKLGENNISMVFPKSNYSFIGRGTNGYTIIYPSNLRIDNFNYKYSFYNDGTYPVIDVNESNQLFDYVPDNANAQEMPNGNVIMYGGITEGYDRILAPNVINTVLTRATTAVPPSNFGVYAFPDEDYRYSVFYMAFVGTPLKDTVINIYFNAASAPTVPILVCSYTVTANQTFIDVTTAVGDALLASTTYIDYVIPLSANQLKVICKMYTGSGGGFLYAFDHLEVIAPNIPKNYNSIPSFLFSTQRKLGIAYFDKKGKTNGILYSENISFPAYSENVSYDILLPYINTKIYHQPPEWAYSYGFYLTKESTQFLYWQAQIVYSDNDFYYFDISNLSKYQKSSPTVTNVLNYTFQDGDRLRLIKNVSTSVVYNDTYDAAIEGQVVDPNVGGTVKTGTFIKIKKFSPFTSVTFGVVSFIIQIYRPSQQEPSGENTVYYEFGQQYPIGFPETAQRCHFGMVSNQFLDTNTPAEFNFYDGDVYFRVRDFSLDNGSYTASFSVLDRNFVDTYISAVNSIDGRASVIDVNAKKAYYSTLVRFSEAYQANTNINGTNRFYPNNFDEYDYSYGDIMRFKVRDRFVRVFQKLKVGQVPLYHQILKEQNKESLVVSDRLLNPIQYYVGDVGIGENSESLASFNFADYFTSNIKGVICRVSNDGVKFLSIDRKIDSWAWKAISQRTGDYKIYGAFDTILQQYIIALEATPTDDAHTLMFDEGDNVFDTYLSYNPEMMATLGVLFVSFKNGNLYTHDSSTYNNFYGQQYDSSVTLVFNEASMDKKTFLAIGEVASQIWDVPEIKTDINSYGTTKMTSNLVDSDFAQLEGTFEASILRDQNSQGGLIGGDTMKGKILTVTFRAKNPTSLVSLNLLSLKYINSPLNNR